MTTIPVLWVSHDPEILHRGYADQGLLESILDRSAWRPPGAFTFEHHEVRGDFPDMEGAVVILPSRHHIDHVDWFLSQLDRLAWSVVILTSEEEWLFPWQKIEQSATRKLWVMQPRPEHEHLAMLPCGPYAGTHEALRVRTTPDQERIGWFFGGQITHARRTECLAALEGLPNGDLIATEGYFQGISLDDYLAREASAKVIPCPSGPVSLCTARVEEAMEAGCVPIVDMVKPVDPQFDYWQLLFGPDHPLRGIYDWATFPDVLGEELAAWPANANRVWAWWQQWKRRIAHQVDNDLREAIAASRCMNQANNIGTNPTPDDLITVIVTTSPAQLHPSTAHIEETIDSIRAQLPDAEIVIVADGVRPEQESRRADYEEYLHRLFWLTNFHWHNVVPIRMETWGHQANATREAMKLVTTPLVLFAEHDTPLKGTPIDWPGLCGFVQSGYANAVRFHHEADILPDHEALMIDHQTVMPDPWPVPVRRTMAWWQRPHLASARFYRERILPRFTPESRTMIEDYLYGIVSTDFLVNGEAAWWDWRIWVYTPEGSMQRSWHLDSRGDEPKYPMTFPS